MCSIDKLIANHFRWLLAPIVWGGLLFSFIITPSSIVHAQDTSSILSFTLVNSETNEPIAGYDPIQMDAVIDLDALPTLNLNIVATIGGSDPGSIAFALNGPSEDVIDNWAPFSVGGDTNGDFDNWTPLPGAYALTATPYAQADGNGDAGAAAELRFTVVTALDHLPPIVNVSADVVLSYPANSTILYGSAIDPDGSSEAVRLQWALQDAPDFDQLPTIAGETSESLLVEEMIPGTYRFRLNAIDERGAGNYSDVFVYVYPPVDQPPIVDAGESIELSMPIRAGTLRGEAFDDGRIVKYEWVQLDGPVNAYLNGRTTSTLEVSNMTRVGHYWFELTVTDDQGQTATDTASISINPDPTNDAPTVRVSENITLTLPSNSAELSGVFADSDGVVDMLEWYQVSGPSAVITPTDTYSTSVTGLGEGVSVFRLNAFDNSGNVGFDTVRITVNPEPNDPPLLSVPERIALVFPQTSVTISAEATDIDGDIVSWVWLKESGPDGAVLWHTDTAELTITDLTVGTYQFAVTVTDDDAAKQTQLVEVTITNATSPVEPTVLGTLTKWHPLTLAFAGPQATETDEAINPFLDYRMQVAFTSPSGSVYRVPGFFAGDGSGNGTGNQWQVRFSADEAGTWQYEAHFTGGPNIAVDLDMTSGIPTSFHGSSGSFTVAEADSNAPGFLSAGRLQVVGEHYLQQAETGAYWIKGGVNSPENWLGYAGFDNTVDQGNFGGGMTNGVHRFAAHVDAWQEGDPNWIGSNDYGDHDGKGLIGALNYLASQELNSIYVMPMNLGGDGRESYPFISAENTPLAKTQYDISKLHQWNYLFEHAQRLGIQVQVVLGENSGDNRYWLDEGGLDIERKLFYREMVARFGYSLALKWNLGEEFGESLDTLNDYATYLEALDWANHPTAVHLAADNEPMIDALLADDALRSRFDATSLQYPTVFGDVIVNQVSDARTEDLRRKSASANHKWIIDLDENNPQDVGLTATNMDALRKRVLYSVLFSGGNLEWYSGASIADLELEDFSEFEAMWQYTAHARNFLLDNTPFWDMEPADSLLTYQRDDGQVFYKAGEIYAIYLPDGKAGDEKAAIDLSAETSTFSKRWYNPRTGRFQGPEKSLRSGRIANLGNPPDEPNEDWVVLLIAQDSMAPTAVALEMVNNSDDTYYMSLSLACLALMLFARWALFRRPQPDQKEATSS